MERTSNIIDDEYSEIVLYVTELRRKFHRKFENQMFVIDQQRVRIDYQQRQIDDQRVVIDELAWQIRDLRDSVRQCTEKIYAHTYDGCSNCSTIRKDKGDSAPSDRAKLNRQNHVREKDADAGSPVYESINFDRDLPTKPAADKLPTKIPVPKLRRQNAVGQQQEPSELDENQKRGKCSASFLDGMIPPPPPSPPTTIPPNDEDTDNEDDLTRFGVATVEKLNKLYAMRNFLRSSNESEATEPSDFDEVTYRIRDFKDFSRRSQRGSSKPMCSLVSDVEANYLPHEDEAEELEIKEIQLRPQTDENANTPADQRSIARCATYTRDVRSAVFI